MSNLLKKASIITTPTAYDDGRILSVKPNENVFGSEEIVNGDFATNSDWTVGSSWAISSGSANCSGATSNLDQASLATNTKYKVTITVSNITAGTLSVRLGSSAADVLSLTKNGTYTGYGVAGNTVFRLRSQSSFNGSVDNVSVVEDLSGDFDFERGSAATRVNAQGLVENVQTLSSELVQNGNFSQEGSELVSGNNSNFDTSTGDWQQFRGVLSWDSSIQAGKWTDNGNASSPKGFTMSGGVIPTSVGKIYRVKFIAKTNSSSSFNFGWIGETSTFNTVLNPNLTNDFQNYEFTFTTSGNNQRLYIALNSSTIGNGESYWIDNVSVKEVGQDWALGSGWSVGSNLINATSTSSVCFQDIASIQSSKTYKVVYQISNYSGGNIQWRFGGTATVDGATRNANGIYTEYFTNTSGGDKRFFLSPSSFSGSITNISVKEVTDDTDLPRINYEDGCGSWLFEPQSTNLITYSEDISNAYWTKLGSSTTSGFTSPSGVGNAYKLVENTSNGLHWMYSGGITVTNATTYNVSVFAKKGERNSIRIAEKSGISVIVNLESKDFDTISAGVINSNITELVDDWVRIDYSFQTGSTSEEVYIYAADNGNISYQGNGSSGIYVWGVQLEQLSYATSYIPTNGAASTRLQDIANNSGNSTLINSTEGVLYAEIAALANDLTNRYITLSDGTSNNRLIIRYSNGGNNLLNAQFRVGGVVQANLSKTLSNITVSNKVAFKYKQNDFALWVNGVEAATDTSGSVLSANTLNKLNFSDAGGGVPFYGKNKALVVFKEALTDAELQALTTI